MAAFVLRRLLLIIPTFLGITLLSFIIINLAPGSPLEQRVYELRAGGGDAGASAVTAAMSEESLAALKRQYGFDKPIVTRYFLWLGNVLRLDFGESFVYDRPVLELIVSKFPVSLQFGFFSLLLTYLICIPLGIAKAVRAGTAFDSVSGIVLYFAYAVPPLIVALVLITLFAGGSHFDWFPIGLAQSDNYDELGFFARVADRAWHFALPLACYVMGGFAELTVLTRNSMLEVIKQDYIRTARSKGMTERRVLYKHALRNSLIPVATGIGAFFHIFLAGSLIIEKVFQLDGVGLLSYRSIIARDYNVIMGLIFLSAMLLMIGRLVSDLVLTLVDPRIDFR